MRASSLLRSVLYIPGSKTRALEKARNLPADAIIFDLEDAVTPDEKVTARETLAAALSEGGYGKRSKVVRVNGLDTDWGRADIASAADMDVDAILVPKVSSAAMLDAVSENCPDRDLWAMMETPLAMLNAKEIAQHPKLKAMVIGTNDLAKEMNARFRADRLSMQAGLGLCVLAAKAYGRALIDGVYNAFKDDEGLAAECEQGRDMGFDGKTLIHPSQISIANAVFAPTQTEVDLAHRQIDAFEKAQAEGQGVAVVDGKIVENLHIETARGILEKAKMISDTAGKS